MIDRIAQALMRYDGIDPNGPAGAMVLADYQRRAHVVLTEMRDPTRSMVDAGNEYDGQAGSVWTSMIDAARQG